MIHPIADCEHPLLCLLGPNLVSQETAISGSLQQTLASVCNGVIIWRLIMGWIPEWGSLCMVLLSVSSPNFVSVTPYMGILFPILTLLEFHVFCELYLYFFFLRFSVPFGHRLRSCKSLL